MKAKDLVKGKTYNINYENDPARERHHGYSSTGVYTGQEDWNEEAIYGFIIDEQFEVYRIISEVAYFPLDCISEMSQKPEIQWHWYKPEEIDNFPEYHSTPMKPVPLMIQLKDKTGLYKHDMYEYPNLGLYIGSLKDWRLNNSNSNWEILAWTPVPKAINPKAKKVKK